MKKPCFMCQKNPAVFAIQTLFANNFKRHTMESVQLRTKPLICESCALPVNWLEPPIICENYEECKKIIVNTPSSGPLILLRAINMKEYPSIPSWKKKIPFSHCLAFNKLDGSLIRCEYNYKSGWFKFGTRTRLMDRTDPHFGSAIDIFYKSHAEGLEKIFKDKYPNDKNFVVFLEFVGPNSFAGWHDPKDEKELVLFDVSVYKKGFVLPKDFINNFSSVRSAELVYEGEFNEKFINDVKNGLFPVKEGVVAKGVIKNNVIWMSKIKTNVWLEELKNRAITNEQLRLQLQDNLKEQGTE